MEENPSQLTSHHAVVVFHKATGLSQHSLLLVPHELPKPQQTQHTQVLLTEREGVMKSSMALWF